MKIDRERIQTERNMWGMISRQKGAVKRRERGEIGDAQATAISMRCFKLKVTPCISEVFLKPFSMKDGISLA